ncbi:flippase [Mucilaginibacter phyllosphaerae]|uniref:Flippase n=1 Tax=Mucilaginibacter phyllosphaerae TaxID=1812349 RepID=A0A4Y8A9F8_9SPHI|nr:flippase [Mucilaginibacter phyllosphaerae]MBB3969707.1 O-antigen/teichoic acid export membrane protein [Mucilaginibacter phyllosphaerae]TEW65090.1 flippase [Mucilaginibacter phyllosphaerae]GGH18040.1 flippase [Mucilaginibacter phyllosphaerae]
MLKKNIFFNFLLSVSQILFSLIIFPYASRTLGPAGIGSVVFIDSITQIFLLIAALGIPIYGIREISKARNDPEKFASLFSELVVIHLICTALFVVGYIIVALFVKEIYIHFNLVIIGLFILVCNVFTMEWFFQGIEQFTYITKRTLLVRGTFIVLLFIFVHKKGDEALYYGFTAASYLFNALFNFFYSRKYVKLSFKGLDLKKHVKPLVIILCSNIVMTVYLLMDNTILGFIKGETPVGFYSTAVKIAKISITIVTALGAVLIPQISSAYKDKDFGKIQSLINKSFNFVCTFGVPICIGMIITGPFLIGIIFGKAFTPSILPLQLLSPIIIIIGMTNIFVWQILSPLGMDKKVLTVVVFGMIVSLVLNFATIPYFSQNGAAISNTLTELTVMVSSFIFVRRLKIVTLDIKPLIYSGLGSALFFVIAYAIHHLFAQTIITEVCVIMLCAGVYFAFQLYVVKNQIILSVINMVKSKLIKVAPLNNQ